MGGRVGGCLVLFPGVCCPKLPHFPPHTPNAPLRPHNTLPGAVIGNTVGSSFKPTSPNSRHEDRLQPN
jgi:hypothetical protein